MRKAVFDALSFANRIENGQTLVTTLEKLARVDQQIIALQGGPTPEDSKPGLSNDQVDRLERLYEKFATQGSSIRKAIAEAAPRDVIDITPTEVK